MKWKDVGEFLKDKIPIVGNLLLGNYATAVGELVSSILGVKSDPDTVLNRLKTDPDATIRLQELMSNHEEKLIEFQIEELKLRLADVDSARKRETNIVDSTKKRDWNIFSLSWMIVLGFFSVTYMLIFVDLPEGGNEIAMILLGALTAGFSTVLQYFFGSSQGSKDKDAYIKNGAKQ